MPFDPNNWVCGERIFVPAKSPQQELGIFLNSTDPSHPQAGTWHTKDISDKVPPNTKAVFLSGCLIITHGMYAETADLRIAFRRPGETADHYYNWQCIEAHAGGGQRSTMAVWVPVRDGKIEYKWLRTNNAPYPNYSAYGVNLSINGILV
jgi:hypothetical protein